MGRSTYLLCTMLSLKELQNRMKISFLAITLGFIAGFASLIVAAVLAWLLGIVMGIDFSSLVLQVAEQGGFTNLPLKITIWITLSLIILALTQTIPGMVVARKAPKGSEYQNTLLLALVHAVIGSVEQFDEGQALLEFFIYGFLYFGSIFSLGAWFYLNKVITGDNQIGRAHV